MLQIPGDSGLFDSWFTWQTLGSRLLFGEVRIPKKQFFLPHHDDSENGSGSNTRQAAMPVSSSRPFILSSHHHKAGGMPTNACAIFALPGQWNNKLRRR